MRLFPERKRKRARLEIVPMIDVMLLLLVFYILSTVTLTHEHGIPVQLPKAATGESHPPIEITLSISREGRFYLNKTAVEPTTLVTALEKLATETPGGMEAVRGAGVVINADLSVQHREVVRAMDALRQAGITRFGIATEPEGTHP